MYQHWTESNHSRLSVHLHKDCRRTGMNIYIHNFFPFKIFEDLLRDKKV
jgi:hypothetical protein